MSFGTKKKKETGKSYWSYKCEAGKEPWKKSYIMSIMKIMTLKESWWYKDFYFRRTSRYVNLISILPYETMEIYGEGSKNSYIHDLIASKPDEKYGFAIIDGWSAKKMMPM